MFVLILKLETGQYQEDVLDKRFEIARKMYNALLGKVYKRYNEMIKTKQWRNLTQEIKAAINEIERKKIYKVRNQLIKENRLSEYDFHADIKLMQHKFKQNIDSYTAQKIATRVWTAMEDLLFDNGEKLHFKKYGGVQSVEGKSNGTGIRFIENRLIWLDLDIKVSIDPNNPYEIMALEKKIKFCRIKRKFIKGAYKYYIQLILDGVRPAKIDKKTGEFKKNTQGDVGLDIGTQTLAISSNQEVKLIELAPSINNISRNIKQLQRYLDRSRRANNLDNFNDDGTIKKGIKLTWNKSKRYQKAQSQLKELHRKQADQRRYDHWQVVNYLESLGDNFYIEQMNFKALQKRSKNTEKNDKGKFKRKKRFGKSLANKAPSMFVTMLKSRNIVNEINTREVKASQYNHLDQNYNKKKLSQRWNYMIYNGQEIKVQRDLYSAYLIQNTNDDLKTTNQEKCELSFDLFLTLHQKEVDRLNENSLRTAVKNVI